VNRRRRQDAKGQRKLSKEGDRPENSKGWKKGFQKNGASNRKYRNKKNELVIICPGVDVSGYESRNLAGMEKTKNCIHSWINARSG